jgi:hypothetical protein
MHTLQNVFDDNQKIAYVGLCYVSTRSYLKKRLTGDKGAGLRKASNSYDYWSKGFMQKLYVFLDLSLDGK